MKYKHKFIIETGPADEPEKQRPNVFHEYGHRDIDGVNYIGLIQEGQVDPAPTWFREETVRDLFDEIP